MEEETRESIDQLRARTAKIEQAIKDSENIIAIVVRHSEKLKDLEEFCHDQIQEQLAISIKNQKRFSGLK